VSEVAVPGRTAHEGKPASHRHERAFAPSPSGRCGHARSVPVWARSTINGAVRIRGDGQRRSRSSPTPWTTRTGRPASKRSGDRAEIACGHPPPPTGHKPLGRTVGADIAITAFEPDMHALAG